METISSFIFLIVVVGIACIVAAIILLFEDYLKYKKFIKKEKEYKFSYATYKDFVNEYNNRDLNVIGESWLEVRFGDSSELCVLYEDRNVFIEKSIINIKTTIVFDNVHMILSFRDLLRVNRFLNKQINNHADYLIERNNVKKWGK